jgi:putative hydrolase of the HAD superfamily
LALRAVVFDYGMVLSGPPNPTVHAELVRITGLSVADFETLYWRDRHAYDEGKLTGLKFWQNFNRDAALGLSESKVDELNHLDGRMWTTQNDTMIAWQGRLKARGILTAILSNMGDNVLASIERTFAWPQRFDVCVWSFQHLMAKPEPAIYRLTLDRLGTSASETLFLDDRLINVEAALSLGMRAIQFSTVENLRAELIAQGLDGELPLP